MKEEILFYLRLFMRRLPLFVLVSGSISLMGYFFAMSLPTQYETTATLLVERQQVTLVESTVLNNPEQELEIIRRNMLTRANMLEIAREYRVFDDSIIEPDEIVELMRNNVSISNPRGRAQVVTVSFTGRSPQVVTNVVNELVTRLLVENSETRTGLAELNSEFFESEVQRLSDELDLQSLRITEFQTENRNALPSSLDYRLNRRAQLQERTTDNDRQINTLVERRQALVTLFEETGSIIDPNAVPATPAERELARLQAELERAKLVFSETNPRISVLRGQIQNAEAVVAAERGVAEQGNSAGQLFELRLSEIDSELSTLRSDNARMEDQISELAESIDQTPNNEIQLQALRRDYSNIQSQYNAAVARLAQAQTGERVELSARGQKITVLEQPQLPSAPSSPNRPLVAGAGVGVGIAMALALVGALELLNGTIRRPVEITRSIGITPLATLPYIRTKREKRLRAFRLVFWALLFFAALPAAAYFVHVNVMPLDRLLSVLTDFVRDLLN